MRRKCQRLWMVVVPLVAVVGLSAAVVGLSAAGREVSLVEAVRNGDEEAVRALLTDRVDVNAPQPDGTTALHWGVHHDALETVDLLIRAGANANAANRYGVRPLSMAATNGNAAIIERLLTAGADPNSAGPGGETALMTAARTGVVEAIQALLGAGADPNARETLRGQTALMWAAVENNAPAIKVLTQAGADLHARSHGPRTPVEKTAAKPRVGYDRKGEPRIDSFTPLLFAAQLGRIEAILALVAAGANVNDTAEDGTSALVFAVTNAQWEAASVLVDLGADPEASVQGWTPLHQLARIRGLSNGRLPHPVSSGSIGALDLVKKLLVPGGDHDHGADVNAIQTERFRGDQERTHFRAVGSTPFLIAAKAFDADLMRLLVEHGADPSVKSGIGSTALMLAAGAEVAHPTEDSGTFEDSLAAVKVALELGNDVNAVNEHGNTALHNAAFIGALNVIEFLVDNGATLDVKNQKDMTPLDRAHIDYHAGQISVQPEAEELLRQLMQERGLPTEVLTAEEFRIKLGFGDK